MQSKDQSENFIDKNKIPKPSSGEVSESSSIEKRGRGRPRGSSTKSVKKKAVKKTDFQVPTGFVKRISESFIKSLDSVIFRKLEKIGNTHIPDPKIVDAILESGKITQEEIKIFGESMQAVCDKYGLTRFSPEIAVVVIAGNYALRVNSVQNDLMNVTKKVIEARNVKDSSNN